MIQGQPPRRRADRAQALARMLCSQDEVEPPRVATARGASSGPGRPLTIDKSIAGRYRHPLSMSQASFAGRGGAERTRRDGIKPREVRISIDEPELLEQGDA